MQECSALGIEGNDIEKELHDLTRDLPNILFEAANKLKSESVRSAVEHYAEFTQHVSQSKAEPTELLPTLAEIQAAELSLPETGEVESNETGGSTQMPVSQVCAFSKQFPVRLKADSPKLLVYHAPHLC